MSTPRIFTPPEQEGADLFAGIVRHEVALQLRALSADVARLTQWLHRPAAADAVEEAARVEAGAGTLVLLRPGRALTPRERGELDYYFQDASRDLCARGILIDFLILPQDFDVFTCRGK